ncbi:hypothetical protein ACFQ5N_08340 [Lutibacter holmesii]|uniref:DUF4251 domain-containing protein n=1 Tax=Lutibacter holmesii TaxID=1137985 RepID=A0ABW3WN38_9FLAO
MKNILLTILFIGIGISLNAQETSNKKMNFEMDFIWRNINGWFKKTESIDYNSELIKSLKTKEGVFMHIPKDYQIVSENKGIYMEVYLFNFTNDTIKIPRIDATIGNLETKVEKDKKWETLHTTFGSSCGNSYWTMELPPNQYILFHSNTISHSKGDLEVEMKIQLKTKDLTIESNLIKIKTYKGLYERLGIPIKVTSF